MELSSLSSLSPLPLCYPKPSSSSTYLLLPFSDRKRAYFGYSVSKRATLRNSCNCNFNFNTNLAGKQFLSSKCGRKSGHNYKSLRVHGLFGGKKENGEKGDDASSKIMGIYSLNRLPRRVVVKSELAGTGTPDASYSLSDVKLSSKVRGVFFYVVTAITALSLIGFMIVSHPFVLLFDRYQRKAQHFVAKLWATAAVAPFFRIEYEGLENLPSRDAPAVYVSNHQSFLDIYTLLTLGRSFKFISKTAIFLFPVIGWAMSMMGTIPLKRMDSRSQLECLKRCMDLVKNGSSVFFFPEGTRSKDGTLGDFKKGAFSVASKTGVPVIPITLIGTGGIMPAGMESVINSGSVKVFIHKPIKENDPEILRQVARNTILDTLKRRA